MTANQIAYANYKENSRHNLATEGETRRSNLANEYETYRHNVAGEVETNRHNVVTETEAYRHNKQSEVINRENIALGYANLRQLYEHNRESRRINEEHYKRQDVTASENAYANLLNARTNKSRLIDIEYPSYKLQEELNDSIKYANYAKAAASYASAIKTGTDAITQIGGTVAGFFAGGAPTIGF